MIKRATLAVGAVGLVLTAVLSWLTYSVAQHNEQHLLRLKVAETGSVLQALVPGVENPLRSAAEITNAAGGAPDDFLHYMRPMVGPGRTFVAASLWRIAPGAPQVIARIGRPLLLADRSTDVPSLFTRALASPGVTVISFLSGADRRLGYALTTAVPTTRLAVYAESPLPATRQVRLPAGSAFSDLRFQLFLGGRADPAQLLYGNTAHLTGPQSRVTVAFGDTHLTLVGTAARPLAGRLAISLWWIAALVGAAATFAAAIAVERLLRGRQQARSLARQLDVSLRQQREIAGELQHALLPHDLPTPQSVRIATRYSAGAEGVDLGGDWYDVVALPDDALFFTVGDVSGRGVGAGAVMARLQYAARALALRADGPAAVLDTLALLLDLGVDGRFATVLCGRLDLRSGRLEVASAGHPPAVLIDADAGAAVLLDVEPGPPIGVGAAAGYRAATVALPPRGALLAYTDGLVERRGEGIDDGLERLRILSARMAGALPRLLDSAFADRGSADDDSAAVLFDWGVRTAGDEPPAAAAPAEVAAGA